jgi:large subunit ribosomal protein L23
MKNPHDIILRPRLTEKSVLLSRGNPHIKDDDEVVRTYTFEVAPDANKIEIKWAIEEIYNGPREKKDKDKAKGKGKAKEEADPNRIVVTSVRTISMKGKSRRIGFGRKPGKRSDWKKAMVTLAKGQMLEDFGV